jgi:hypothetical protein
MSPYVCPITVVTLERGSPGPLPYLEVPAL